jgi:hypothetical protein
MAAREEFLDLLRQGDVDGIIRVWRMIAPDQPQPESREAAEAAMHLARTQTEGLEFVYRGVSHMWLTERGLPSMLPDHLRPSLDRVEQRIEARTGVAVMASSEYMKPVAKEVEKAMAAAAGECHGNGTDDPEIIRAQMEQAKSRTLRQMLG